MAPIKRKILFVCTEDWFFKSHFLPLAKAAIANGGYDVSVLTTIESERGRFEELGLHVVPFDFQRSSMNPLTAVILLWRLVVHLRRLRPDLMHFIALKPVLLGGLAALFLPKAATVYHVTGLGYLAEGKSRLLWLVRNISFRLIAFYLKRSKSWLICENPDDRSVLGRFGAGDENRTSIFGGAGVNPEIFPELPPVTAATPRAAFVGRMIWTKGVDVLIAAKDILTKRGVELNLDLFGAPDTGNPRAIQLETLQEWNRKPGVKWHGPIADVRDVWRGCDISIVPTRTREGMPLAMLEAAASGRALIVTDVPGCRHFVRDGREGLIVPPDDAEALADAMEKLADDQKLRLAMGKAARQRVLEAYTEDHVRKEVIKIYQALLETGKT